MSLYRKYRPTNFDNLVGQDPIAKTLKNALKKGEIAHAYLFCGPRGTGKTSTARLIARALNCLSPTETNEACNTCETCTQALESKLIDIIEIDAASNRGIDEIRALQESIHFAPSHGKKKVYIIDEVHMLTKEAFNALLKTLEEPPSHAHFMLATTEVHKVPETIISRCQRFDFKRVEKTSIVERLRYVVKKENMKAEPAALEIIATFVHGGMRDALSILDQMKNHDEVSVAAVQSILGLSDDSSFENLYAALEEHKPLEGFRIIQEMDTKGTDLHHYTIRFLQFLREKMHAAVADNAQSINTITKYAELFQEAAEATKYSSIPALPLEIAIAKSIPETASPAPAAPRQHKSITQPVASKPKTQEIPAAITTPIKREKPPVTISAELETLQNNWKSIISAVTKISLRPALKVAKLQSLENNVLSIAFNNEFYAKQVEKAEHKLLIENVLTEQCNEQIRLNITFTKEPYVPPSKPDQFESPPPPIEEMPAKQHSIADQAASIFGGEVF